MSTSNEQKQKSDIDEIRDSVKESILERVSSPLIGSFAISWVIVNWKAIAYFMLSEEVIVDRLSYIKTNYSGHLSMWIIPLFAALVYVFGYPWPNRYIIRYRSFMKRRDEEVRLADEDKLRIAIQQRQNSEQWRALEEDRERLEADSKELSIIQARLDEDRNAVDSEKEEFLRNKAEFLRRIVNDSDYQPRVDSSKKVAVLPLVEPKPRAKTKLAETIIGKVIATGRATPEQIDLLFKQNFVESDIEALVLGREMAYSHIKQLHAMIGLENIRWLVNKQEPPKTVLEIMKAGLTWDQVVSLIKYSANIAEVQRMLKEKMSFENILNVYKNHNGDRRAKDA